MNEYKYFQVECTDGVCTITLDREPLNVLHNPMMAEFNAILEVACNDSDLAAIVLDANHKAFSAGVDVSDHTDDKVEEMIMLFHGIFRKLVSTDALTIAVVKGAALGGGCEVACFCDIVLASEKAKFGQPEVQVGVFPPIAACVFPQQIGMKKAIELITLGDIFTAQEALTFGLVNHVFPIDEFDTQVDAFLSKIKNLSIPVIRLTKKATTRNSRGALLKQIEEAENIYLKELMKVKDAHEGIAAFLNKRAPIWSNQ